MRSLYYLLHSGQLFGTERMAMATIKGLGGHFDGTLVSPAGPLTLACHAANLPHLAFGGSRDLVCQLLRAWRGQREVTVLSTGVSLAAAARIAASLARCRLQLLEVVHGGTDERLSYGRKPWLARCGVPLVAVSAYVRQRLLAHGAPDALVHVIENFLPPETQLMPTRPCKQLQQVAIVSRLDPIKRVHLLFAALALCPPLRQLQFDVYGDGSERQSMQALARQFPNVTLHGVVPDVPKRLESADLLLHLCPEEPFGLAILEAMAARLPALVPDCGGAANIIISGQTGACFSADSPTALAAALLQYRDMDDKTRLAQGDAAILRLQTHYNGEHALAAWRQLLGETA